MKQGELFACDRPLVVFRLREDDRIEVRWPDVDLIATFRSWRVALDMVQLYERDAKVPFSDASVRVRR